MKTYLHLYCSARPSLLPHFLHLGLPTGPVGAGFDGGFGEAVVAVAV